MLDLAAQLAAHGPLRVLDGGNQFNVYPVARAIRRQTPDLNAALQRIVLSRAFTCYQMVVMLDEAAATSLGRASSSRPSMRVALRAIRTPVSANRPGSSRSASVS